MVDLSSEYLGLALRAPLIVSSNPLCGELDSLKRMRDAGAGAVVLQSLFEEQITLDANRGGGGDKLPPALRHLPDLDEYNRGAAGYLSHLHAAKAALDIPVIASLNGSSRGGWVRYARLLEQAGADAVELNVYYLATDVDTAGSAIEDRFIGLLEDVKENLSIPVAVKLSPYFSSIPHMAARLAGAGADGLVLFNRFYQPDFDLETGTVKSTLVLSDPSELRLRLRWTAILHGRVKADLAITGGVHSGWDVVKAMLAGAQVAMTASAILQRGIGHLSLMLAETTQWLEQHRFDHVADLRGHLSHRNSAATAALERANYMGELGRYSPS